MGDMISGAHRILVTGSNGLLGQKLTDLFIEKGVDFLATSRGENRLEGEKEFNYATMDVTDRDQVMTVFQKYQPTAVIHTAAMTQVDQCETEKELCDSLNVDAVANIIEACKQHDAHLLHLSTDFIFDGKKGNYKEDDEANPLSYYAESKWSAEQLVENSNLKNWSIARTIIIYGITHKMSRSNLVLWVKASLEAGKAITVVDDQFRSPTLAEDLAMGCWLIIDKKANGVFHLSGPETKSIIELAYEVADHFQLDKSLISPISSTSLNQAAKRPPKTGFDISKAKELLDYDPKPFTEGLKIVAPQIEAQLER